MTLCCKTYINSYTAGIAAKVPEEEIDRYYPSSEKVNYF